MNNKKRKFSTSSSFKFDKTSWKVSIENIIDCEPLYKSFNINWEHWLEEFNKGSYASKQEKNFQDINIYTLIGFFAVHCALSEGTNTGSAELQIFANFLIEDLVLLYRSEFMRMDMKSKLDEIHEKFKERLGDNKDAKVRFKLIFDRIKKHLDHCTPLVWIKLANEKNPDFTLAYQKIGDLELEFNYFKE
jgi:hypothetical protein